MNTCERSQNHETERSTVLLHLFAAVFLAAKGARMAVETMAHDWEFDRFDDGSQSEYHPHERRANIRQYNRSIYC